MFFAAAAASEKLLRQETNSETLFPFQRKFLFKKYNPCQRCSFRTNFCFAFVPSLQCDQKKIAKCL